MIIAISIKFLIKWAKCKFKGPHRLKELEFRADSWGPLRIQISLQYTTGLD